LNTENFSLEILEHADVIIVNNLHNFNKEQVVKYLLATKKPWIKYDHDLLEEQYDLYQKSTLNIFLSPMHQKYYEEKCGTEIASKSIQLPVAIDPDAWPLGVEKRIPNSVFIPAYYKCRDNVQEFIHKNPDKKYFTAGQLKPLADSSVALGQISYDKMSEQYCQYETVLHTPDYGCAGERVLFEAILSGCKVITNENAGYTTWDFDWRDERVLRPILKRALYQLWHEIEKVIP
jgi:hypothetical protein